jgi:hypothetical protein
MSCGRQEAKCAKRRYFTVSEERTGRGKRGYFTILSQLAWCNGKINCGQLHKHTHTHTHTHTHIYPPIHPRARTHKQTTPTGIHEQKRYKAIAHELGCKDIEHSARRRRRSENGNGANNLMWHLKYCMQRSAPAPSAPATLQCVTVRPTHPPYSPFPAPQPCFPPSEQ